MLELDDDLFSNPLASVDDGWVLYHGTPESYSASMRAERGAQP